MCINLAKQKIKMEGHKEVLGDATTKLKREIDSLDDFEHLGHDSSPLVEVRGNIDNLLDLKTDDQAPTCVLTERIDNKGESVGSSVTGSFDQLQELDQPLIPQKVQPNLLDMGDTVLDHDKYSSFVPDFETGQKSTSQPQDKFNIQSFMDNERNMYDHDTPKNKPSTKILERYSDSEPDDDEFVQSKIENVPEKVKGQEFHQSSDHFKGDDFHDLVDMQPQLPKKDSILDRNIEIAAESVAVKPEPILCFPEPIKKTVPEPIIQHIPEPAKEITAEPIKEKTPEPPKEKTPEPIKEKTPEPIKEKLTEPIKEKSPEPATEIPKPTEQNITKIKAKIAPADAEAIFCKMGLGEWNLMLPIIYL